MSGTVSVVIPCYTERRWAGLVEAVRTVQSQTLQPDEIVVVVDHNPRLYERACAMLPGVTVLESTGRQGAAGSRNTGVFHTTTPLIALLDDDCRARTDWLAHLVAPFRDRSVVGTGGTIAAIWERHRPVWLADEFLWTVGDSTTSQPSHTAPTRNVWAASMAVRRDVFTAVGGFRDGFGKVGDRARPEDTDLCLRMSRTGDGHWLHVPESLVEHAVPAGRATFGYFLTRCYQEGRGKVEMSRLLGADDALRLERTYLRHVLPRAVGRNVTAAARGRGRQHTMVAAAMIAGVVAAGVGGIVETLPRGRPGSARMPVPRPWIGAGR
jgi:glycosyltransferase involved in cell wall biosynthesis